MQHITIFDFLLLPLYLYLFYILVKRKALQLEDRDMMRIFLTAFFLRMLGSVAYSLMVQYYYGYGDSFTYYSGGNFIINQILKDFGNIKYLWISPDDLQKAYSLEEGNIGGVNGYIGIASSVVIMKISAIIAVVSFNKFLITSLFFGLFSFAGQWRLFKVFNDINKDQNRNLMAWAVLYTPSIWFWGSGLMKEAICMGGLGFVVSILYKMFVKKKFSFKDLLVLVFFLYLITVIKSYIIIIFAVSLSTVIFFKLIDFFKNVVIKMVVVLGFLFFTLTVAFVTNFTEQLQTLVQESKEQVDTYQRNYEASNQEDESSKAGVDAKEIDATLLSLLLHSPQAIFACLYRPFIWESRKVIILFTSLESMLLLFCTIFLLIKTRIFGFFKIVFNHEYVLFSLVISLLFALVIGFTTYNFGSIVRYKIMLLPFYYFMMVSIYTQLPPKMKPAAVSDPQPA